MKIRNIVIVGLLLTKTAAASEMPTASGEKVDSIDSSPSSFYIQNTTDTLKLDDLNNEEISNTRGEIHKEEHLNAYYSDNDPWEDSFKIWQFIRGKLIRKIKSGCQVTLITSVECVDLIKSGNHVIMHIPQGNLAGLEYFIDLREEWI